MTRPQNPFLFGKPVSGERFCNRSKELARLRALVRSQNSVWLHSPRRFGKTSLILEAFHLEQGERATALVDLYPVSSPADFVRQLLAGLGPLVNALTPSMEQALRWLGTSLRTLRPTLSLDSQGRPVFSVTASELDQPGTVEEALAIPEQIAARAGRTVVLALDEFQEVAGVEGLEARLRSVMQRQEHVSYVLAGSRRSLLETMFTDPRRPFFQFAEHLPLGRIEAIELVRYVRGRFETSGVSISDSEVDAIVAAAAGHPHMTQYFASVAWELRVQGHREGALLEAMDDRVASALDPGLRSYFDSLATTQRLVLLELARRGGEELLSRRRLDAARLGSASSVSSALQRLAALDVIEKIDGTWRFVDPSLPLWLRMKVI